MAFALRVAHRALRARPHPLAKQRADAATSFVARKIDLGQETQKWRLRPSRVNPKIQGNPFGLFDSIFLEPS